MCRVMQNLNVPDKESGKMQTFRILLINKCQQQFERDKAEELDVIKKQEEIDACTDPVSVSMNYSNFFPYFSGLVVIYCEFL